MTQKKLVCCDFDGTITVRETFVAMLKQFAPEKAEEIIPKLYDHQVTLREGVREMLEAIPSAKYPDIIESAKTEEIRPGLVELLDFLDSQDVPFVVVSGGLRGMVETTLGELVDRVKGIHAVDVDTRGEFLQPYSEFEGSTEMVEKVKVVEQYQIENWVAIGDSVTDLNMAIAAPLVFARSRLCEYLDDRNKSYIPYDTFFDVRDRLAELWK
ncbi:MAG TPA: HAD-IB family phosphatase [Oscillatoriales cyanobacterium M4454_W2019_049]|nr:HAD-IB family phosphatase [Oscillatoriales cyanobacterium M4454_W2019_049]